MPRNRRRFLKAVAAGVAVLGSGCVGSSDQDANTGTTTTEKPTQATSDPTTTAETITDTTTATTTRTAETTRETTTTDTTAAATTTDGITETGTAAPTETTATVPSSTATPTDAADETTRGNSAEEVAVRTPLACDGSLHRLDYPIDEVRYGSLDGFELMASQTIVARGDSITFRLENITDTEQFSGNNQKYDIQRRTNDGWQSVYWVGDAAGYTDEGIAHPPENGFTWEFTLSREGVQRSTQFNAPYSVCEELSPGEYRFVYWGLTPEQEEASEFEEEYAIGRRFTVTE